MKNERGITIISLVISIIVLIILSVIAIKTMYDHNLVDLALDAAEEYETVQDEEMEYITEMGAFAEETLSKLASSNH